MMTPSCTAVILAAGQGTRMKSHLPKVLHPILGIPMVRYSVDLATKVTHSTPVVVIGHASEQVQSVLGDACRYARQAEQKGTAHAVLQAEGLLQHESEYIVVLSADMPLLTVETIQELVHTQQQNDGPLSLLTVISGNSHGFGRIIRGKGLEVIAIVEEALATPDQLAIQEYNAGAYCFRADWLWNALRQIRLSPKGEYFLTDTVQLAKSEGMKIATVTAADPREALGVNTRVHLAEAEGVMRERINTRWMLEGVTLIDPNSIFIEPSVQLDRDVTILPETFLQGITTIGEGCVIGPGTIIRDSRIGRNCTILSSVLESAVVEEDVEIGPFCHLRKGAHLGSHVHLGNFGEVKDSYLANGVKMGHFSYIGNATIGENVNIGAGTITCNYDGARKNPTIIEKDAFIGSDTMLVAPVTIGKGAKTGAGSVVNRDVPPDTIVVGVPARPIKKKG